MSETFRLSAMREGEIAEIVELIDAEEGSLAEMLGIAVGMPVIVLQKAAAWLVQIGGNQLLLSKEASQMILVKNSPI